MNHCFSEKGRYRNIQTVNHCVPEKGRYRDVRTVNHCVPEKGRYRDVRTVTCQSTKGCLTSQSAYGVKLSDCQILIMFIAIISHFELF